MKLSVVIPAFNESKNFYRGVLNTVDSYLKKQKYNWEVILVNDGSTDSTLLLLKKFAKEHKGFRVLDIPHAGKVGAVSAGVLNAEGEYVLFTDFDQSTPISEVGKVLDKFKQGADVVIGERKSCDVNRSLFQTIRSKMFNLWVQALLLPGIRDSQCGFKAFKRNIGKHLFDKLQVTHRTQKGGYMGAFDAEILFLAKKNNYKIATVPVSWTYFKSGRLSLSEPLKMARDVLLVRLADLNVTYIKKDLLSILLLLILTVPAFRDTIRPGFFPMHDDLQFTRQLMMDECFKDGQIPCRWSKHLGYGYGYPLFNYYPPFPYYLGQPFRWLGLQYVDVVKVVVVLNFIVSALTMYFLTKEFWGRWGGLISGLLFVYAPYHAVDIYVRAAMNEAWAIAFFPAVLWSIYRLITTERFKYVVILAVSASFLLLSHNPITMIFAPVAIIWAFYWLIQQRQFKVLPKLILGGIWSIGLAAFFTLPVLFEAKYAHIDTLLLGYFNYLAHFVDVNQLFIERYWGYGASNLGPKDEMSFQVGHLHWVLALLSLGVAFVLAKRKKEISLMILLILGITLAYTFLTHQRSSFIWLAIPQLHYLQFPWRFLSFTIFGVSFLAGSVVLFFSNKLAKILPLAVIILIIFTFLLYQPYFKWRDHFPYMTDGYRYTENIWRLQITSGIFDYLPIWAPFPPAGPPNGDVEVIKGEGEVKTVFKNSIRQEYQLKLEKDGLLQINTFYFPGWKYYVNNKEVSVDPYADSELGRPRIKLVKGDYTIVAILTDTIIRKVANILSIVSWIILFIVLIYPRIKLLLKPR